MARQRRSSARSKVHKGRMCGTMTVHSSLLERDPGYASRLHGLEEQHMARLSAKQPAWKSVTIPVVVNVVFKTKAENISQAQILSQIAVLNKDYTATNPDKSSTPAPFASRIGNPGVKFKLVKVTRTPTTEDSFADVGNPVKSAATGGVAPTSPAKMLNIWVCTLADGLLGYAQFPAGPVATDGVVILNTAFGTVGSAAAPFNKGRSATHEIGHWLNLRHIWGDNPNCVADDGVGDTPKQAVQNFGKPHFPHISCSNGPNGDMFMNYMDYVDDAAMFMFSQGQVERMHTALLGPRKAYRA